MTNPYVFVVGCPRSGTTLFRHILDARPQIAITPEAHWIPRFFEERRGLTAEGVVTLGMGQRAEANEARGRVEF